LQSVVFYSNKGNLEQFMLDYQNGYGKEGVCFILSQICNGMIYLHHSNIIHGDLASRNILLVENVDKPFTVKISDFGIASIIKSVKELQIVPEEWSPEAKKK